MLNDGADLHFRSSGSDSVLCCETVDMRMDSKCIVVPTCQAKVRDSYTACLTGTKPDQPRFTIIGSGS